MRGRSARAPSARRRCCRASGCSCRPAPPPPRTRACSGATVPQFHPDACTGCMECALVCPDAAIPNTVHEIHDLLLTAIDGPRRHRAAARGPARAGLPGWPRASVSPTARTRTTAPFPEVVAAAAVASPATSTSPRCGARRRPAGRRLAIYPVARTRPFFDAMEKATPGTGGLFAATIDPWKCTGCLECIEVCGPGALTPSGAGRRRARARCRSASSSPPPCRTPRAVLRGRDRRGRRLKRLMLDRAQLLLDDRRARRLPRVRRGHRDPAGHGDAATPSATSAGASTSASSRRSSTALHAKLRLPGRRRGRTSRADRVDHRHPRAPALPLRGRPDRQRPGPDRDRELDRLQQRLRLDDAVQLLPRPVGEQPVPGRPAAGQGHLRGRRRPDRRRRARPAPGRARARRRLRPGRRTSWALRDALVGAASRPRSCSCCPPC